MDIRSKSGISLVIVVTAIVIMITLISVATVVGSQAITSANFDEYISSINRVSDSVNEYYLEHKELPIKSETVNITSVPNEFKKQLKDNNDASSTLYVVNVELLEDSTIKKGRGTLTSQDVFLVAKETHNVYYMKGFKYKKTVYYGV